MKLPMPPALIALLLLIGSALVSPPLRGQSNPADSSNRTAVLLKGPVVVTAILADIYSKTAFSVTMRVQYKGRTYEYETLVNSTGGFDGAAEVLRGQTGWKGEYLFVPFDCNCTALRGTADRVFKVAKDQLEYIGSFPGYGPGYPGHIGSAYDGKYFLDYYDKHELCRLTSHAGFPSVSVMLVESGGRFRVDVPRTWEENQEDFKDNAEQIALDIKEGHTAYDRNRRSPFIEPLLRNAVIAKYCDKADELREAMAIAKKWLTPADYGEFVAIVQETLPGEQQKHDDEVRRIR
jgi:hypothetical protein